MAHPSNCPKCQKQVLIPENVAAEAIVRCPLCHEEYSLCQALEAAPPMLIVVSSAADTAQEEPLSLGLETPAEHLGLVGDPLALAPMPPVPHHADMDQAAEEVLFGDAAEEVKPAADEDPFAEHQYLSSAPPAVPSAVGEESSAEAKPAAEDDPFADFAEPLADEASQEVAENLFAEPVEAGAESALEPPAVPADDAAPWNTVWPAAGEEGVLDDEEPIALAGEASNDGMGEVDFAAITGKAPAGTTGSDEVAAAPAKRKRPKREASAVGRFIGMMFSGLLAVVVLYGFLIWKGGQYAKYDYFHIFNKEVVAQAPVTPKANNGQTAPVTPPAGQPAIPPNPTLPGPTAPDAQPQTPSAPSATPAAVPVTPEAKPEKNATPAGGDATVPGLPATKPDAKPELPTVATADSKPEVKSNVFDEKPEPEPKADPLATPDAKADPFAGQAMKVDPIAPPKVGGEPKPATPDKKAADTAAADPFGAPEPPATKPAPKTTADAKPANEPSADADPFGAPEPKPTPEKKPEPKVEIKPAPDIKPIEEPKPIIEPKPLPEPKPLLEPKPVAEPKPIVEPKPEAAGSEVVIGPRQPPVFDAVKLDDTVKAATKPLMAKSPVEVDEKEYANLCAMAQVVTFVKAGADEQKKMSQAIVELVAGSPKASQQIVEQAKKLLADPASTGGIVLAGAVSGAAVKDGMHGLALRMNPDDPAPVMIMSAQSLGAEKGDRVLVFGSMITEPAKNLAGYSGTKPMVIWSSMVMKLQ